MGRLTGTIKRIVTDRETGKRRGFGFISADGVDYFFHARSLTGAVREFAHVNEGDEVRFRAVAGDKGPVAVSVEVRA